MKANYRLTTAGDKLAVIDHRPGHYQQVAICDSLEEAAQAIAEHNEQQNQPKQTDTAP